MQFYRQLILWLLLCACAFGQTTVSGVESNSGLITIGGVGTAVVPVSITIAPSNPTVCYSCAQLFSATMTFSNGSTQPITTLATWSSSNPSVATTSQSGNYLCVARGTVTVSAVYLAVTGTTTLNCQSPTFTPQGIQNVTQSSSSQTLVQYTGADGIAPFTFTAANLPAGWSLSSAGCPSSQINCSLIGTPSAIGTYNFYIQATDNLGNTACSSPGCQVGVAVAAGGSEGLENQYCTPTYTVTGLSQDGPAQPLLNCNYTTVASTSLSSPSGIGTGIIINVCSPGGTSPSLNCLNSQLPTKPSLAMVSCGVTYGYAVYGTGTCTSLADGPFYSRTFQGAVNFTAWGGASLAGGAGNLCGAWIQAQPAFTVTFHTVQAVYIEPNVQAPVNINCGPAYTQPWVWVTTSAYDASTNAIGGLLPGNRITPGWVGQSSIVGRPAYAQPTTAGIYSPMWEGEELLGGQCPIFTTPSGSAFNGLRIMGIEFACAHGRDTTVDLYGNNVCPANKAGTPQCDPGFIGGLVDVGCYVSGQVQCTSSNVGGTVATTNSSVTQGSITCPYYCATFTGTSGTNFQFLAGSGFNGLVDTQNAATGGCPAYCVLLQSGQNFGNLQQGQAISINGVLYYVGVNTNPQGSLGVYSNTLMSVYSGIVSTTAAATLPCTGNCVVWVSGDNFSNLTSSETIDLNGTLYTIGTVYSSTLFSVTSSVTKQNSIPFTLPLGTQTNAVYLWDSSNQININGVVYGVAQQYTNTLIGLVTAPGTQSGVSYNWQTGSQYIILDRNIFSETTDITQLSNFTTGESGLVMQGGQHLAAINNYFVGFTCLYGIGPCVDAHAILGGVNELTSDVAITIINNYIESAGETWFFGGGASNATPMDLEIRGNHKFKPLTWKIDNALYTTTFGTVGGAYVHTQNNIPYQSAPTCTVNAPQTLPGVSCSSPQCVQASCTALSSGGNGTADTTNSSVTQGTITCPADCVSWDSGSTNFSVLNANEQIWLNGSIYDINVIYSPTLLSTNEAPGSNSGIAYSSYYITDTMITAGGKGYGICYKGGSSTNSYGCGTGFTFTDSVATYTSCNTQLAGDVYVTGTAGANNDVFWVDGDKFTAKLTSIQVNGVTYAILNPGGFINTKEVIIVNGPGTLGSSSSPVPWSTVFQTKGDCVEPLVGYYDIKNLGELKSGIRALMEGEIAENCWTGQSDQFGFCFLITPKNPNNLCPNCSVTDVTYRYNFCRNTLQGAQIAVAAATQGGEMPSYLSRISIHDDVFDAMIGQYLTAGTAPIYAQSGTAISVENASQYPFATNNVTINHITAIFSSVYGLQGYLAYTGSSALELFYNPSYTKNSTVPTLLQNIAYYNNIAGGGVKSFASHSIGTVPNMFGAANCTTDNACINPSDPRQALGQLGPSEVTMRQNLPSDYMDPVSGGLYQGNIVTAIQLTAQGTGGNAPTSCTMSAPSCWGSGPNTHTCAVAQCQMNTSGANITKIWPSATGAGYTSAPTVSFSGGNTPTAVAWIGGSGQLSTGSGCFDHNVLPVQAWVKEVEMGPYPTAQLDAINNTCFCPTGGYNNTAPGSSNCSGTPGTPITSADCQNGANGPCSWNDVGFVSYTTELNTGCLPPGCTGNYTIGAECSTFASACTNGQIPGTPDLHLCVAGQLGCATNSPLLNGGNDGNDPGANIDLVMGCDGRYPLVCTAGTPSAYTGISITNGVANLPQ